MAIKDVVSIIKNSILPIFENNGYELYDIEFVKEGPNWYLRIYADKEGGITIDDCELISKETSAILDKNDPIEQAYILEVSSPGIDRPLKKPEDYEKYKGEIVDIKLYKSVDKVKAFQGKLLGLEEETVTIEDEDGKVLSFKLSDIASCRLSVIF
ncbi:ribosome maturation factor RimP [Anaeropeptidivorans aminofermentans]|uniref:ribosome maturation factor RimP n=1 Tax=Anaeropeptidivorans aminofermentans TaxID=2934315 RepID=UPI0020241132|nr:ribosome maturation factor RimP [Anaeropeptidivorans aminofermentans]MBE6011252.1 ribosome maturation factor RimP [Lachnospiraceae bacterium]